MEEWEERVKKQVERLLLLEMEKEAITRRVERLLSKDLYFDPSTYSCGTMGKEIESLLSEQESFYPGEDFRSRANVRNSDIFEESFEAFWARAAEEVEWFEDYRQLLDGSGAPFFQWYVGGKINIAHNCLDRHVKGHRKNKVALIWEGEEGEVRTFTYYQLYREVNRLANALRKEGVDKGDRVTIYLGMVPELPIAMLACARIGAVHSVVFAGFSAAALRERVEDSGSKMLITADGGFRRGKLIPLKENVDEALKGMEGVERVVVVERAGREVSFVEGRDIGYGALVGGESSKFETVHTDSEDPLFILYTSGTTGKPKGVVHTHGGYNVGTHLTTSMVFDIKDEDVYWCTADIGWITGHSYIVYGPLSVGATSVVYEGAPDYPTKGRFWDIVDRYGVTIFYTAPTAIRSFMRLGEEEIERHDLSTLRLLGTVGEPINPEAWKWYFKVIGGERCPIVDTWWQTETGMIMITTMPGIMPMKPGSAGKPLPGVEAEVLREDGKPAEVNEGGYLVIKKPWPAMLRTVFGDPERYQETYWSRFPGYYLTGDGARVDGEGYIRILGRTDDVLTVSGHRIGTMELESALVAHPRVAEAAVVGKSHEIKGQAIAAYVVLKEGLKGQGDKEALEKELKKFLGEEIGPIARPEEVHIVEKLPKTRSGKIMRRVIRALSEGEEVGDISTLEDESALEEIRKTRG